jgi:hypothetical protein
MQGQLAKWRAVHHLLATAQLAAFRMEHTDPRYVSTCAAVCNPGVEPVRGSTKQDVRSCCPGHAKHGPGNFKCAAGTPFTHTMSPAFCCQCAMLLVFRVAHLQAERKAACWLPAPRQHNRLFPSIMQLDVSWPLTSLCRCKLCHGRGYTPRIGARYCR